MMSFSAEAKAELCRDRTGGKNAALAEAYGILLFCNTFSAGEVRIITSSPDLAQRLPRLFRRAFNFNFDTLPPEGAAGKVTFLITQPEKIEAIFRAFGSEAKESLSHHVNLGILEEEDSRIAFLRGAFLAGGSVTDPIKGFHMELSTRHPDVGRETCALIRDLELAPRQTRRAGSFLIYLKQADAIANFFTSIGADVTGMNILNAKVDREMRNTITRRVNCDSANADKTVSAAQEQLEAIRYLVSQVGLDGLPELLKEAALLRIANPEASLADLSALSSPVVTKSCLSHRLKKIVSLADAVRMSQENQ